MKNNRGQIFALYLFLLTIAMCTLVLSLYLVQQKNARNSLVSPLEVLKLRNDLAIFELLEEEAVEDSIGEVFQSNGLPKTDSNREEFILAFRSSFLQKIKSEPKMMNFLSENLVVNGEKVNLKLFNIDKFIENGIYKKSENTIEGNKILIKRGKVIKTMPLEAEEVFGAKISFPVEFSFEFEKSYEKEISGGI
ncbi:MAG: hypothetical protein NUV97_03725 [archaeon]|nr:hypothetical protein [archaeon]MCR4323873.1 hypothetical protein [Nanoarchaeota archaeon]